MRVTNFSIDHRTTIVILLFIIVIVGSMSYMRLPREASPDIKIPYVMVMANYEGSSPSDMESLVTRPLERKLKALTEMKKMTSTSAEGSSTIMLEFEPDVQIDFALQKVRDKVKEAKPDLPDDLDEPSVMEISASNIFPVLYVMVSGGVGIARLKNIAEDLEENIEAVRGVLDAEILGGVEREIRVEFDQDRLAAYGLTIAEVVMTVKRNNQDTPGGSLEIGEAKFSIKVPAEFASPDEVDHLVVAVRDGQPIYLSDVAAVRDTFKDRDSFSRIDGKEAIAIKVTKRQGENLLKIADRIKGILDKYRQRLPHNIRLTVTSDSSEMIDKMVGDLEDNMITGLILVVLTVFISLGLRNALLVSLAIPYSMLITFFVLDIMGITLNMVVLFSLILAVGMLVDNSIVIVEVIYRHHFNYKKPLIQAAKEGVAEVAWPVIGSTMTTVAAFFPLMFWPGIMGQFMGYLPKTVIITLLASLFVAMIMTPPLCAIFMRRDKGIVKKDKEGHIIEGEPFDPEDPKNFGPIIRAYRRFLMFGLRYRVLSLFIFFGMFVATLWAFTHSGLGVELFPDTEPSRIMVNITAPEGTNVYRTNDLTIQAEEIIAQYGNIKHVTTTVGGGGANNASTVIDLVDREVRKGSGADGLSYFKNSNDMLTSLRVKLTGAIIGAEVKVDKEKEGPPTGAAINVEIAGDDYNTLSQIADNLKNKIGELPGIVDLDDDYESGLPEVKIIVDKQRAALLGLDAFTIGQLVKASVGGIKIANYRESEDEYDITARLPEHLRKSLPDILRLRIPDTRGNPVPLTSVANIVQSSGLSAIKHIDQKRIVTVSANVAKGFNAQERLAQVQDIAAGITLPQGYFFQYTGENEVFQESQSYIMRSFIIALLLVALVLVLQFDSIIQPLIIMSSVVLSLIGIFLGLMFTKTAFGVIMTGMAVISLAGVVVNNAIVLLEYTIQLRKQGMKCYDAIILASCTRFRPVLLTAITTVLGLLPMVTGVSFSFRRMHWSIGAETTQWWGPMATGVSFGLTLATALTLFVVPSIYSLLYDWRLNKGKSRASKPAEPAPAAPPAAPSSAEAAPSAK